MIKNINNYKIGIIGNGSWATAIAKIISINIKTLNWWVRKEETKVHILKYKKNPNYLSNVYFKNIDINISCNINNIVYNSDIIFIAIPSLYVEDCLRNIDPALLNNKIVVTSIKGIIPGEYTLIEEYLVNKLNIKKNNHIIISGPCHAEEVAINKKSYITIAGRNIEKCKIIYNILYCNILTISLSEDIKGIQLSSIIKNIYAICTGMCIALGYGDNFISVLISNCIKEMEKLLYSKYKIERNINKSVYLGDLLATCYSNYSRNRKCGENLILNNKKNQITTQNNMIAEGYFAIKLIYKLINNLENFPILKSVHRIINENSNPCTEINILANGIF